MLEFFDDFNNILIRTWCFEVKECTAAFLIGNFEFHEMLLAITLEITR